MDESIVRWTEQRLAAMVAYTRLATSAFLLIPPVFAWSALRYPALAAALALAGVGEAAFLWWRMRRSGTTRDPVAIGTDLGFCLVLMVVGAQAAEPGQRLSLLTVLLPFSLVCPALLGFGVRRLPTGVLLVTLLGAGWVVSLYPGYTVKLASDLLGFALWFVVARLISRELRALARATATAQDASRRLELELAERAREAAVERERSAAHRAIHDYLLPVVQHAAASETDDHVRVAARQGLVRARQFLDVDQLAATSFRDGVSTLQLEFPEATAICHVEDDPPPLVADTVLAAAHEALTNARKHAGGASNLYVGATADEVTISVRDHGPGFDPDRVGAGGGFRRTFRAVEELGGTVDIVVLDGVKVTISWRSEER